VALLFFARLRTQVFLTRDSFSSYPKRKTHFPDVSIRIAAKFVINSVLENVWIVAQVCSNCHANNICSYVCIEKTKFLCESFSELDTRWKPTVVISAAVC